jgi:hypothetical protein
MTPRLIELCFQTAGLWEMGSQGRMGLPLHVDYVSSLGAPAQPEERLYAVVTPQLEQECFDAVVVDAKGTCYLELRGYRTVALPGGIAAEPLQPLKDLMSVESAVA